MIVRSCLRLDVVVVKCEITVAAVFELIRKAVLESEVISITGILARVCDEGPCALSFRIAGVGGKPGYIVFDAVFRGAGVISFVLSGGV